MIRYFFPGQILDHEISSFNISVEILTKSFNIFDLLHISDIRGNKKWTR